MHLPPRLRPYLAQQREDLVLVARRPGVSRGHPPSLQQAYNGRGSALVRGLKEQVRLEVACEHAERVPRSAESRMYMPQAVLVAAVRRRCVTRGEAFHNVIEEAQVMQIDAVVRWS